VVLGAKSARPGRVVLGTEGHGIQVSDDAGVHFSEASHGFTHMLVKQIVADPNLPGHVLIVVQRAGEEILESRDSGKSWAAISSPAVARGAANKVKEDRLEEIYASPWGWLARMSDADFLLRDETTHTWKEWKLRLSAPASGVGKRVAAKTEVRRETRFEKPGALVVFAQSTVLLTNSSGVARCASTGLCNTTRVYAHGPVRAMWTSRDGGELAVVQGGKLGISGDGGERATWRDLPVAEAQVLWLDVSDSDAQETVILGTTTGLYASEATSWRHITGGLPQAPVAHWLRGTDFWVITERDGGMYVSRDRGANWIRVDGDAERSQFTGLVVTGPETVLVGSQSEGVLQFTLPAEQGARGN
jgi:hypothetical protein